MVEPYIFGDSTPGQRSAGRGSVACRPGHPGYVDEELRGLCDVLARNPGIRTLLGPGETAVSVGIDKKAKTLMFVVAVA